MRSLKALTNPPNIEDNSIRLPKFQPEEADTDVQAWLTTAGIWLSDRNIQVNKFLY